MTGVLALQMKLILQIFFTLAVLSFLYRDNPIYRFAEHCFVGVAAGYFVVVEFHTVFMPNLVRPLRDQGITGLMHGRVEPVALLLLIPGALGLMAFFKFHSKTAWLSRWPMAVVIGIYSGQAILGAAQGDLIPQIKANVLPIVKPAVHCELMRCPADHPCPTAELPCVPAPAAQCGLKQCPADDPCPDSGRPCMPYPGAWVSFRASPGLFTLLDLLYNLILIVGVACCLVYFFFSKEHTGATGAAAGVGIMFLMISFGASYGNTVMTRVSLFLERVYFLLRETTVLPGGREFSNLTVTGVILALVLIFLVAYRVRVGPEKF